mmetsp:Transcript_13422/g.24078  ORF Transcript_13422/g.24078 Transcript_13422/m.24078 type:complete len:101 (-) Transcript_13422:63-365(-)
MIFQEKSDSQHQSAIVLVKSEDSVMKLSTFRLGVECCKRCLCDLRCLKNVYKSLIRETSATEPLERFDSSRNQHATLNLRHSVYTVAMKFCWNLTTFNFC